MKNKIKLPLYEDSERYVLINPKYIVSAKEGDLNPYEHVTVNGVEYKTFLLIETVKETYRCYGTLEDVE